MHRAVLLLVLVNAAAMRPSAQPARLSAVNPWLSACDLNDTDELSTINLTVCDTKHSRRDRKDILAKVSLTHCRERSLLSALNDGYRNDVIKGGDSCVRVLTDIGAVDNMAKKASEDLAFILARYDCGQNYSVIHRCEDCQDVYRQWVCSALLPVYMTEEDLRVGGVIETAGRGTRSASVISRHQQTPPLSPPRKRSTSRNYYKLYASNNKITKLKTDEDNGDRQSVDNMNDRLKNNNIKNNNDNNMIINNNNINKNNNGIIDDVDDDDEKKIIINDKGNNLGNYDINNSRDINNNVLSDVPIKNEEFFDSSYFAEYNDEGSDGGGDEFVLVDEQTMLYYNYVIKNNNKFNNNINNKNNNNNKRIGDVKGIYGNVSNSDSGFVMFNSNNESVVIVDDKRSWNDRLNSRSEQRIADVRKYLDNRLMFKSGVVVKKKRRRRNVNGDGSGVRYRVRPCLSVCQEVERKCPYFLPGDKAPSYPTQYAGEPTFLCLDPNIQETGEQLLKSNYGNVDCCYFYCGTERHPRLCTKCQRDVTHPTQDQPHAPQCTNTTITTTTSTTNTTVTSKQQRTATPNIVIVLIGISLSCTHFIVTINNFIIKNSNYYYYKYYVNNNNENKQSENNNNVDNSNKIKNNKDNNKRKQKNTRVNSKLKSVIINYYKKNYMLFVYIQRYYDNFMDTLLRKCLKIIRIVECVSL